MIIEVKVESTIGDRKICNTAKIELTDNRQIDIGKTVLEIKNSLKTKIES